MTTSVEDPWAELDDFLGDLATNDPAAFYAQLRAREPVHFNPRWNGWVLTRYKDVASGFRDFQHLSSNRMAGPWGREASRASGDSPHAKLFAYLGSWFTWMDPPDHTRFRKMLGETFTPRSVEQIRPRVAQLVGELLHGLPRDAPFDFIERFSFHLPVIVISEYLGTPAEARDEVRQWSDDLSHMIFVRGDNSVPRAERAALGERAIGNFVEFFGAIVADRRAAPRDDLISRMTTVQDGGDALTDEEIISQCILMLFAGHETTANLLANGIVAFDRFPDQWQLLRAEPELARTATEEMLRYDGPIAAQGRWARTAFEIGGKPVQQGDRVLLAQYAANRDPEAFADPDRFDITRNPNRHVGFGHGIHNCLGAPLARVEVQEALTALAREFAAVEVVSDPLRYKATLTSRSLECLQVKLHPGPR